MSLPARAYRAIGKQEDNMCETLAKVYRRTILASVYLHKCIFQTWGHFKISFFFF